MRLKNRVFFNVNIGDKISESLQGKVAVIAGGRQGVGLGIAQELVNHGAPVVVTGRRQATLEETVAMLGPKSSGIVADKSNLAEMEAMFKETMTRHGRLDAVVAIVGIARQASLTVCVKLGVQYIPFN